MLGYLTLIFICQFAGEFIAGLLSLPIPGPVIGMVLMLALLIAMRKVPPDLGRVAEGLLGHLSLLFVPAAVGVMLHFHLIGSEWMAMSAAIIVSTLIGIAVTGIVMAAMLRRQQQRAGHGGL